MLFSTKLSFTRFCHEEYGRTCKDIGCLPSETCVIASDSCSWSQQEGKECGSYPTCKKSSNLNNSPGKRNLNMVKHAKFDFLIVFVYCISFRVGSKFCTKTRTQTKSSLINDTSQTNKHTHTQNTNESKLDFYTALESIRNKIGKLHGLNTIMLYSKTITFSYVYPNVLNEIIESHRPHLSLFLLILFIYRCQLESGSRQHPG